MLGRTDLAGASMMMYLLPHTRALARPSARASSRACSSPTGSRVGAWGATDRRSLAVGLGLAAAGGGAALLAASTASGGGEGAPDRAPASTAAAAAAGGAEADDIDDARLRAIHAELLPVEVGGSE